MKPNDFFERIIYINLDRRTDRRTESEAEFSKHRLAVERFPAVDGVDQLPAGKLTRGEIGCRLSHLEVLKIAAQCSRPVLILEDDVEFHGQFIDIFSNHIGGLPPWDLLYLGGNHVLPTTASQVSSMVRRVRKTYTTSSYAVNPAGAKKLIEIVERLSTTQVDVAFAQVQSHMNSYAFYPALAWQKPGYSDIQEDTVNYKQYMKK